jgi:hypothetical protein
MKQSDQLRNIVSEGVPILKWAFKVINMKELSTNLPVPLPEDWARIHTELQKLRKQRNDANIPDPPVPLILAGAAFSTASEIRSRWVQLIDWVNQHGFVTEMGNIIPPAPEYDVAEKIAGVTEKSDHHWWEVLGNDQE